MNNDTNKPADATGEVDDLLSRYRAGKAQGGKSVSKPADVCGETRLVGEPLRPKKTPAAPEKPAAPKKPAPAKKPAASKKAPGAKKPRPAEQPHGQIAIGLPLGGKVPTEAPLSSDEPETITKTAEKAPIGDLAATHFLEDEAVSPDEKDVLASHLTEGTGNEPPVPNTDGEDEDEEPAEPDPYEGMSTPKKILYKVVHGVLNMSFLAKALIYTAVVLVVSAYLSYFVIEIGNDVFALVTGNEDVAVTIPEEATEDEVAELLLDKGLIDYKWPFKLFLKYYGKGEAVQFIAGEHTMNLSMNYSQMLNALTTVHRERIVITLTFPEGFTVDDIIDLFVKNGIGTREGFVEAINHYPYKHDFVRLLDENGWPKDRVYRLEGYLYPDTYDFYTDTEEYLCINKLLNNFNDKVWVDWKADYEEIASKEGFSLDQIITLASLVQAEGRTAEDFEYISQVFHNRLSHAADFPRLESDATIQYAYELAGKERESDSTKIDLSFPSPFNTYLYDGLTPGAICNPGLDAILAAIYPCKPLDEDDKEVDVYFFVSNNAGKTYYAATKAAHERNKQRVANENAEMAKEAEENG